MASQEQIEQIRAYCYFPSQAQLPDNIISDKIDQWAAVHGNTPKTLYNALLDCLRYLIYTDADYAAGSAGNKRTESVGNVSVSVESTGEYISKYQRILDGYLQGDLRFPGIKSPKGRGVIVGGVNRCEIERVKDNPFSVDGLLKNNGNRFKLIRGELQ